MVWQTRAPLPTEQPGSYEPAPVADASGTAQVDKFKLLAMWEAADKRRAEAIAEEAQLRKLLQPAFFPEYKVGTNNHPLRDNYVLKATFGYNYTFASPDPDKDATAAVEEALDEIEKLGAEGAVIADRLVRWKPELVQSEYKQLDKRYREIIDRVLKRTPKTPSYEITQRKRVDD